MMDVSKEVAINIIQSVARGVPPIHGIEYYTAGLDEYLKAIQSEYLKTFIAAGGASFKMVIGGYGQGKTHFLYCVQDMAWKDNYVTSYVALSPVQTPFSDPAKVYSELVKQIAAPPEGIAEPEKGIDNLICQWYLTKNREFDVLGPKKEEALDSYLKSLPTFESLSFTQAVRQAFRSLAAENEENFEQIVAWLNGELQDKKVYGKYGILQKVNKVNAFALIRSVAKWVKEIGYSGLIVLFDETETLPSFSSKQKEILLSNLRQLIDECSGRFRNVLIFYSLPDEGFLDSKGVVYEALKTRLDSVFHFRNPTGTKIRLDDLPVSDVQMLEEVGSKLAHVYQVAYDSTLGDDRVSEAVHNMAKVCYEHKSEGAFRRLFVLRMTDALNMLRLEQGSRVDPGMAKRIVSGQAQ